MDFDSKDLNKLNKSSWKKNKIFNNLFIKMTRILSNQYMFMKIYENYYLLQRIYNINERKEECIRIILLKSALNSRKLETKNKQFFYLKFVLTG